MNKYKYAWNSFTPDELEKALNELGEAGWRLVHMEWDDGAEKYYCLVEKEQHQ